MAALLNNSQRLTLGQLLRFGLSGAAINLALFAVYLLLTYSSFEPLLAATLVFGMGIPISLWVHGRVSFRSRATSGWAVALFFGAYGVGYGVQMGVLGGLHYGLGIAHSFAQLIAMGVVAVTLFIVQKYLVFRV